MQHEIQEWIIPLFKVWDWKYSVKLSKEKNLTLILSISIRITD